MSSYPPPPPPPPPQQYLVPLALDTCAFTSSSLAPQDHCKEQRSIALRTRSNTPPSPYCLDPSYALKFHLQHDMRPGRLYCLLHFLLHLWPRFYVSCFSAQYQPRTQALWFVYVIKRTWEGTRGRKMENSAGSAW
jgi:hypothetical protein